MPFALPGHDCPICPRLAAFREQNRIDYPHFFNAPVPSFGTLDAELLVVGLAPGLQGANATGRPFTGDYAGDILYASLLANDFATGSYTSPRGEAVQGTYSDNLTLVNCRITNAVRCLPPENKPETDEIKHCNAFLTDEIKAMPKLKVILTLGLVSHNAVLRACGHKAGFAKFTHGGLHVINRPRSAPSGARMGQSSGLAPSTDCAPDKLIMLGSYHCSRYNINTGRLSQAMFNEVVATAQGLLGNAA